MRTTFSLRKPGEIERSGILLMLRTAVLGRLSTVAAQFCAEEQPTFIQTLITRPCNHFITQDS